MTDRLERILAYVDDELAPAERANFEAELASDPELAAEAAAQAALRERISGAYRPVLNEPVPLGLALAAQTANDRGVPRWAPWAAAAASLVIGVLAGRIALPQEGPFLETSAGLAARGEIAQALSNRLAADAGTVRIGLTFRDAEGRWCRTFQSAPDRLAGLACREGDQWLLQTAAALDPAAPEYRTAGSDIPAPVVAAVDLLITGEALDAAQERAARDAGWGR